MMFRRDILPFLMPYAAVAHASAISLILCMGVIVLAIRVKRVPIRVSASVRITGRTARVVTRNTVGGKTTVRAKSVRV